MVIFSLFIILSSFIYCQCDEFSYLECNINLDCSWEENLVQQNCNVTQSELSCDNMDECTWDNQITYYSCSNFGSSSSCAEYADYGCSWEFSWGGWMNHGSSCVGGGFQIDNGSCSGGNYSIDLGVCEQLSMPSCSDMDQPICDMNDDCEWVENIETSSCSILSSNDCELVPECNYACTEYDSWYTWLCVESGCTGGTYEIDNSTCEEIEMVECSDFETMSHCTHTSHLGIDCQWIESIDYNSCSGFSQNSCNQYDGCSWTLSYGGSYGSWSYSCSGSYGLDSSFCDEIPFILGDINQDYIINIQDIILVIDLVLNNEYNISADLNFDDTINVTDIVQLVNIILN